MTKQGNGAGQVKAAPKTLKDLTGGVIADYNAGKIQVKRTGPLNDAKSHPDSVLSAAVANMSFAGFTRRQVCEALRISETTLQNHYIYEYEHGCSNMVSEIAGSLAQRAKAGSDTAAIFLLKTRGNGKFSEKTSLELSGQVEITHKAGLVQELATMISAPNVIEGEKAEPV